MLREEVIIIDAPCDELKNYTSGTSTINFNDDTKEWTITNIDGANVFLQYTTDMLNIGDTIEVEFEGVDNGVIIQTKTEVVGGSWQDAYAYKHRVGDRIKRVKLPCKVKGKHIVNIGLPSVFTGEVIIKNIKIKIKTDLPKIKKITKLQANIYKKDGVWKRQAYRNGNECTVEVADINSLLVTFADSIDFPSGVGEPCAFISSDHSNSILYYVLPAYQTKNSCRIQFFDVSGNKVLIDDVVDNTHFSLLLI